MKRYQYYIWPLLVLALLGLSLFQRARYAREKIDVSSFLVAVDKKEVDYVDVLPPQIIGTTTTGLRFRVSLPFDSDVLKLLNDRGIKFEVDKGK